MSIYPVEPNEESGDQDVRKKQSHKLESRILNQGFLPTHDFREDFIGFCFRSKVVRRIGYTVPSASTSRFFPCGRNLGNRPTRATRLGKPEREIVRFSSTQASEPFACGSPPCESFPTALSSFSPGSPFRPQRPDGPLPFRQAYLQVARRDDVYLLIDRARIGKGQPWGTTTVIAPVCHGNACVHPHCRLPLPRKLLHADRRSTTTGKPRKGPLSLKKTSFLAGTGRFLACVQL